MKKNKLFILGLVTVFVALVSLTLVSSTWAKYTTTTTGTDSARVAYWGFNNDATLSMGSLFEDHYTNVQSEDGEDVIAPGTQGSVQFQFSYKHNGNLLGETTDDIKAPEVAYTFTVSTAGSTTEAENAIIKNPNIVWALDGGSFGSWTKLLADIEALSGDASGTKEYAAGSLPAAFNANGANTHTVHWKWIYDETVDPSFENKDVVDTAMGNAGSLESITLVITITATQKN